MPKQGEVDYLCNIGADGTRHALEKPFSDDNCGTYLMELGAVMNLLPTPPAKLLDLGCGTGWTSCLLALRGYQVTGQDIAEDMIQHAERNKERYQAQTANFVACDYEAMGFEEEFDCALFFDSLHHSTSEDDALQTVFRALKSGGVCVTSEPGRGHARSADALHAVESYQVTERDMPPSRIIRSGKKAGFRRFRVYPHTRPVSLLVYGGFPNSRLHKLPSWLRSLGALWAISVEKHVTGIVVMVK